PSQGLVQDGCKAQPGAGQLQVDDPNILAVVSLIDRSRILEPDLLGQMKRLVGPGCWAATAFPLPVVFDNQAIQVGNIVLVGTAGVLEEFDIPDVIQIARTATTLSSAELDHPNLLAAARFTDRI